MSLLLTGGRDADGLRVDVRCREGRIAEVAPQLEVRPDDEVWDLTGSVLLPAAAEPHAHLDKAFSAERAPNPAGDLDGAIAAWRAVRPQLTEDDVHERGRRAALELVANGATAIRSHADVGTGIGLRAVRALVALREELRRDGRCELQVVALAAVAPGAETDDLRRHLVAAVEAGADVVGGAPHLCPDPAAATRVAVACALDAGLPVDLHADEHLRPDAGDLGTLSALAAEHGLGGRVTASHCVSLAMLDAAAQAAAADAAAAAGVAVVTLPQTNLYLQARGVATAPPRGLTALRALLDAGVTVAAGADNCRDPFCSIGRADPLETAALLVLAGHLSPAEAWAAITAGARAAMGLEPVAIAPGSPAELLAVAGSSATDALARADAERTVVHRGRVVARSRVQRTLPAAGRPLALEPT